MLASQYTATVLEKGTLAKRIPPPSSLAGASYDGHSPSAGRKGELNGDYVEKRDISELRGSIA